MINFEDVTGENIKDPIPNWPQISHNLYRIILI